MALNDDRRREDFDLEELMEKPILSVIFLVILFGVMSFILAFGLFLSVM